MAIYVLNDAQMNSRLGIEHWPVYYIGNIQRSICNLEVCQAYVALLRSITMAMVAYNILCCLANCSTQLLRLLYWDIYLH